MGQMSGLANSMLPPSRVYARSGAINFFAVICYFLQQQGISRVVLQSRDMHAGILAFLRNNKLINNLR